MCHSTSLKGKVAVVTRSSRGIGQGIPIALGEQSATVYIAGRTPENGPHPLLGALYEIAEAVKAGGRGVGIAAFPHTSRSLRESKGSPRPFVEVQR